MVGAGEMVGGLGGLVGAGEYVMGLVLQLKYSGGAIP